MENKQLNGIHVRITDSSSETEIMNGKIQSHVKDQIVVENSLDIKLDKSNKKTNINIHIKNDDYGEDVYSGIIKKIKDNFIIVKNVVFVKKTQGRADFRLKISIPVEIYYEYGKNKPLEQPIIGTIKDISVGGMMFTSNTELVKDFKFNVYIDTQNEILYITNIKIVRKMFDDVTKIFSYGCSFSSPSDKQNSDIRKFIFTSQTKETEDNGETENIKEEKTLEELEELEELEKTEGLEEITRLAKMAGIENIKNMEDIKKIAEMAGIEKPEEIEEIAKIVGIEK